MKRLTRDLAEHGIYTIADLHQAYLANSFTRISVVGLVAAAGQSGLAYLGLVKQRVSRRVKQGHWLEPLLWRRRARGQQMYSFLQHLPRCCFSGDPSNASAGIANNHSDVD